MCKRFVRWKDIFFLLITTIPLTHFLCGPEGGRHLWSLTVTFQGSWHWLSFRGCCWVTLLRSCVERQTWVRQMPGSREDPSPGVAFSLPVFGPACSRTGSPPITLTSTGNRKIQATSACPPSLTASLRPHTPPWVLSAALITADQRTEGKEAGRCVEAPTQPVSTRTD